MALTQITEKGIKDGEILNADINANAAISKSKIENLINNNADNRVITGSGTANTLNGESNVVIDSSGNVGIGTTSPSDHLTVSHSANTAAGISITNTNNSQASAMAQLLIAGGDNSKGRLKIETNGAFHTIDEDSNGNLILEDNGTERMRIDSSGKVGIGTTSPAGKLHVSDVYHFLAVGGNATTGMKIGNYDGSSYGILTTRGSQLRFDIGDNNKMVLDASGRLLLGTTTEGGQFADDLTIANSGHTGITIRSGTDSVGSLYFSDGTSGDDEYRGAVQYNHTSNFLRFYSDATERMRIDSSGKVLIGVSSSVSNEAILQAFGTTNASFIFGSTATSATGTATINMCPSNSITGGQIVCTATEDFSVSANRSANLKFNVRLNGTFYTALNLNTSAQALFESITNSGNHFQINNTTTSNTGTMLNINSSRNTTNGSYYLAQWGSTSTTRFQVLDSGNCANINNSFSAISDQTLKENIVDAGSQWDDIKNLKVRKFNFIEATDPDKKTMLGVVAQEAETVCPNLVETISTKQNGEEKEVKSFKYSILYMKAIKCLQEAQAKIETLETKVAALEAA